MLVHYVFALLVTAATHFVLAVFVYFKGQKKLTNVTYALYSLAIAWWSAFEVVSITRKEAINALFWWRINHVGVIFIPIFFLHFVVSVLDPPQQYQKKPVVRAAYLFGIISLLVNFTPFLIREVVPKFSFNYFINPGPIYGLFFTLWVGLACYGLLELFKVYLSSSGARRNQLIYFCWSMFVAYIGGIPNFFPTFNIEIPYLMPFGTYAIPLYAFATAHAIVRHRLMDINVVITRTAVFTIVYAVLLGVPLAGALAWEPQLQRLLGNHWWVWLWVVGAGLTTAAHYLNLYLQQKAEARLLREQRRYQANLMQASRGMTEIRELKRLMELIVHVITRMVGLTHAAIFLEDLEEKVFVLSAFRYGEHKGSREKVGLDDALIRLLKEEEEPIVLDELKAQVGDRGDNQPWDDRLLAVSKMEALNASVVVPSFIQERLIGFLVLGEKRKGQVFTTEDLTVFSTLANQAGVAIENARFYEGEKARQAALFHAATLASLGTMASSMGHQVNNRFNVVALVSASERLKLHALLSNGTHDEAKLREALKECEEQFRSLEEEALNGGQIVASLRKLARPSGDTRKPLALRDAVQAGVDVVQHKVHFQDFDFVVDIPEDLPQIIGDVSLLGECFLNFIDNAYDAIKLKEELLEEGKLPKTGPKPFRGKIEIKARLKDAQTIRLEVSDNGTGVRPEQLLKMFIPFYTTKATAEKGTGLGLYVIKQIIESHDGTIAAKSTYGEGMAFAVGLPAAQAARAGASNTA